MAIDLKGRGGSYVRVSSDDDKQTPERQRESIFEFEKFHKVAIPGQFKFEDSEGGWRRSDIDVRPDFQKMLAAIDRRQLDWVVVNALDRGLGKNKDHFLELYLRFRKGGCRLYDTDGVHYTGDDLQSIMQGLFGAETSEREMTEKARRVIEEKTRLAKLGEWMGGHVAWGMDIVCLDKRNNEIWRCIFDGRQMRVKLTPDGKRERFDGKGRFPAHEQGERLEQRPSLDKSMLAAVRTVFEKFVANERPADLVRLLTTLGHKPTYSDRWEVHHIDSMLRNPIYTGRNSLNKSSQAQYRRYIDNKTVPGDGVYRENPEDQWAMSHELFKPVVEVKVWEDAQKRLRDKPTTRRAPRSSDLYLARLLFCECGSRMRGVNRGNRLEYICSGYATKKPGCKCHRNTVYHSDLEKYVQTYLSESGQALEFAAVALRGDGEAAGKLRSDRVSALTKAGRRFREMLRAVSKREDYTGRVAELFGEAGGDTDFHDRLTNGVSAIYRRYFREDEPAMAAKLAALEKQYDDAIEGWKSLPTVKATERARLKLEAMEAEIEATRGRLVNLADELDCLLGEAKQFGESVEAAEAALRSESAGPAKAQALAKVIGRIELTFTPTGHTRPHTIHDRCRIVSVGGDETREYPNSVAGTRRLKR